jgi:hypothetical protein
MPNQNPTTEEKVTNLEIGLTQIQTALGTIVAKLGADEKDLNVKEQMREEIDHLYEIAAEEETAIREKYKPLIKSYNRENNPVEKTGEIIGRATSPLFDLIDGVKKGARR